MNNDLHLLHLAINQNINLLTCEQMKSCSMTKLIQNYDFNRTYKILGLLDASTMFKCLDKKTNFEYALKIIPIDEFDNFIGIYLQTSDIKQINGIANIIHENQFVFVFFETSFDDLHSYLKSKINQHHHFDIQTIRTYFKQIIEIVHQLHQRNIVLNDLKLRKFVFVDSNRKLLKLENLDGVTSIGVDELELRTNSNYGCILYVSPEKLNDNLIDLKVYDPKSSDIWSLGVILYTLTFGRYPFHHQNLDLLKEQILNYDFTTDSSFKHQTTNESIKTLITSLLNRNPMNRPKIEEILENDLFDLGNQINLKMFEPSIDQLNQLNQSNKFSSKEYYSKLIKLIKSTQISIQTIDQIKSIDLCFDTNLPIIHYFNR